MPNIDTHTNDAPGNWQAYSSLLRHHAGPALAPDRSSKLLPQLDIAIEQRARRRRNLQFVMAPAAAVSMLIAVFMFTGVPWMQDDISTTNNRAQVQSTTRRMAPARQRHQRSQLPAPTLPDSVTAISPLEANVQTPGIMPESVHVNRMPEPGPGIVSSRAIPSENIPIP